MARKKRAEITPIALPILSAHHGLCHFFVKAQPDDDFLSSR